jgi:hypothetical protein
MATSHGHRRVGLGLLLLAAAAPYRYYGSFPLVASVSVLDAALLLGAFGLLARRAMLGPIEIGDRRLFALVCVLPVLSLVSTLWTADLTATIRETLSYGEGVLAYVYVIQQTQGMPAAVIMRWIRRFLYVMLIPPVLMLTHVPGFMPQDPGIKTSSGDYLSYFSRLSHPFIGRSNNMATVLLPIVVVLVYWAVTRHDTSTYVASAIATIALALTVSRGAILALLIAALVLFLRRRGEHTQRAHRRLTVMISSVGLAVVLAAWSFYVINPDTHLLISGRLSLSNVFLRESRLSIGFTRLAERPLLGYGAGTLPGNDPAIAGGVHNTYLQQLLAYGVVLGLIGVASLIESVRYFLRGPSIGLRRAIGLALLAALLNFAVESSFEGQALRVIIYLVIGLLVGLLRASEQPGSSLGGGDVDADSTLRASTLVTRGLRTHGRA